MSEKPPRHNTGEAAILTIADAVARCANDRPVLVAGPTASGKSALALAIAEAHGGVIVNADALQVYARWRILTARPSPEDELRAPHALYGHVADASYSVGRWLRDAAPASHGARPIFTGGTGLYFMALTQGLNEIPETPPQIRAEGDAIPLPDLLAALDARTRARLDPENRARVQRAWEVQRATGKPLADWQDRPVTPLLPLAETTPLVVHAPPEILSPRIERRFAAMIEAGALDEVRANAADFDLGRPADRAIGAPELMAHLQGRITLDEAIRQATIATRQYAKRQRTWFRSRMADWLPVDPTRK
ncbi:tRNA dimethylallyltransferase [Palleronia marisminoris]|uniref:tRNA dimethylallyltransferase n=1 Tax=Palleronia marisminoris TaxID=315423 RepID=A0A1Y5RCC1_9RHOB|nr:tRNA (adenosine(37)-N6)-dimethylallyltransferase MiaA [Palleronia marisminoris]SFG08010.1 tRNA dimethylallyltransferase [Palleronia marisminoris]SLN11350.1 tRNA dimethylallyltransferase [Palleronia marisminoris]